MNTTKAGSRIILAVLVPLLIMAVASSWFTWTIANRQLQEQSGRFGQAIADQLAVTSVDYLVSDDVLSLNVLLDDLMARGNFEFAAVYGPDNRLLAQSGRHIDEEVSFTRTINYQDANLGYALVQLDQGPLQARVLQLLAVLVTLQLAVIVSTGAAIHFYGDLLYLWISGRSPSATRSKSTLTSSKGAGEEVMDCTVLALKIRPARLIPVEQVTDAAAIYGAEIEASSDEEWVLTFRTPEHLSNGLLCGLLVREIIARQPGNLSFRAGADLAEKEETAILRKRASYLASLADGNLLVSQRVHTRFTTTTTCPGNLVLTPYHSSLTIEGEVFAVESTDHLIVQQAQQLMS